MLDLGYVRANLAQVKERLGRRGADVAAMLDGFEDLDLSRRSAITRAEMLNAERNQNSAEVARRKQKGEDAAAWMARTRGLKEEIER
ncbi:MAG: serine--tRNA ligase, partial [Acidobacteriaceae bacterium]